MSPEKIVVVVLLVSLMLQTGLQVNVAALKSVLMDYSLLGRALLANFILVPLFALLLVRVFHLNDLIAAGVLLMAIAPGVPLLPRRAGRTAGGSLSFAISFAFLMPAISFVTAPFTARLIFPADMATHIPVGQLVVTLAAIQLVPLAIGMLVAVRAPALAGKLIKPLNILFFLCVAVLLVFLGPVLIKAVTSVYGSYGMLTAFLIVLFSVGAGWLLGGPDVKYRNTLGIATAMRNIGLASLVATLSFPGTVVGAMVMAYFLIQFIVAFAAGKIFAHSGKVAAAAPG